MATHLSDLELTLLPHHDSPETTEFQKAWHLLSIILSIRRPATLAELASRCTLFPASPDLVEYLCSIRHTPLFLTADLLVTLSPLCLMAFAEFVSNSNLFSFVTPRVGFGISSPKRMWDGLVMYSRKRRRIVPDYEVAPVAKRRIFFESADGEKQVEACGRVQGICNLPKTIANDPVQALFCVAHNITNAIKDQQLNISGTIFDERTFSKVNFLPSLHSSSSSQQLTCKSKNVKLLEDCASKNLALCKVGEHVHISECQENFCQIKLFPNIPSHRTAESVPSCKPDQRSYLSTMILDNPIALEEANDNAASPKSRTSLSNMCCPQEVEENNAVSMMDRHVSNSCELANDIIAEVERTTTSREVDALDISGSHAREYENPLQQSSIALYNVQPKNDSEMMNKTICMMQAIEKEKRTICAEEQFTIPTAEHSVAQKQLPKSYAKTKPDITPQMQSLCTPVEHSKTAGTSKVHHNYKRDPLSARMKQNHNDTHIKARRENSTSVSPKDQTEPKELPKFESFIVEEEEGSGGYGTVYRARRKSDGVTVAIKCPHAQAHKHHVTNELKMLERFGGKNFVIKYEGCFKSSGSDCFVLEHVEHDRPEVLKKDIDIFQLQWYGYCMFKALASLHKQGIVHRDVKPGNFLFSRKGSKGYLIDFNLATDLHQKYGTTSKAKTKYDVNPGHSSLPSAKSISPRKFPTARSVVVDKEAIRSSKSNLDNLKRKAAEQKKPYNTFSSRNIARNQCGDGSGITSTKDVTSTRTPSAERMREPLPSQGRKELINLLQEARQTTPIHEASHVPAPLRKRVAASPGQLDRTLFYLTPMPLHSTTLVVAGAGLMKNKGDGKLKREGPCVGTKGFRAPEVLLRSFHQGPKVDVWSAGVTLLYFMTGRTPFFGDPEQNMKEIAKLRGSEDLWEVAKLHNREASFPVELYNAKFLPTLKLRDWCQANTKRPDFLKVMPRSLLDLVDKCLTVNPRARISAEEALKHEFFAPCHEGLRRQRLMRRGLSMESGMASSCSSSGHIPSTLEVADQQAL